MAQPESQLSRKIMTALREQGYFCYKNHGGPTMMAGLPDICVCAEGLFIMIETKMPADRQNVSTRQRYVHGQIRRAQGLVFVACGVLEALERTREAIDWLHHEKELLNNGQFDIPEEKMMSFPWGYDRKPEDL